MAGRRFRQGPRSETMRIRKLLGIAAGALLVGACTVMPTGPSMLVLPGTGRSVDNFRYDDNECRQYAFAQIGGTSAQQAANQSAVGSAVGVNSAYASGYGTQRQYDNAYIQCMYAKGHRVPVPANMAYPRTVRSSGTTTGSDIPPPPPGTPPPPPPR